MKLAKPHPPKESEVQSVIVEGLRAVGLQVYHTSAFRQKGPSGVAKGVPDLLVVHPGYAGTFLGLEVKRSGKIQFSSPEQARAAELGHIIVVQSLDEAFHACAGWLFELHQGASVQIRNLRSAIGNGAVR